MLICGEAVQKLYKRVVSIYRAGGGTFVDLADVNRQVREWLDEIANKRIHSETRERPDERFRADALKPLPPLDADYGDTVLARVHKIYGYPFAGRVTGLLIRCSFNSA